MMIPGWSGDPFMSAKRAFMIPLLFDGFLDGPASIAFTDGFKVGAVLDRNGYGHLANT